MTTTFDEPYWTATFDPYDGRSYKNIHSTTLADIELGTDFGLSMPLVVRLWNGHSDGSSIGSFRNAGYWEGDLTLPGTLDEAILRAPISPACWMSPHGGVYSYVDAEATEMAYGPPERVYTPWHFVNEVAGWEEFSVPRPTELGESQPDLGHGIYMLHSFRIMAELPYNTIILPNTYATINNARPEENSWTMARLTATGPFLDANCPFGDWYTYAWELYDDNETIYYGGPWGDTTVSPSNTMVPCPRKGSVGDMYGPQIDGVAWIHSNMLAGVTVDDWMRPGPTYFTDELIEYGATHASNALNGNAAHFSNVTYFTSGYINNPSRNYTKVQTVYVDCQESFSGMQVAFWGSDVSPMSYYASYEGQEYGPMDYLYPDPTATHTEKRLDHNSSVNLANTYETAWKWAYHKGYHGDFPKCWTQEEDDVSSYWGDTGVHYESDADGYAAHRITEFSIGHVPPGSYDAFYGHSSTGGETPSHAYGLEDIDFEHKADRSPIWAMWGLKDQDAGWYSYLVGPTPIHPGHWPGNMYVHDVWKANRHTAMFYKWISPDYYTFQDFKNNTVLDIPTSYDDLGPETPQAEWRQMFLMRMDEDRYLSSEVDEASITAASYMREGLQGEVSQRHWWMVHLLMYEAEQLVDATLPYPRDHKAKMQKAKPFRMTDLSSFEKGTGDEYAVGAAAVLSADEAAKAAALATEDLATRAAHAASYEFDRAWDEEYGGDDTPEGPR